jgi:hypothetical protein
MTIILIDLQTAQALNNDLELCSIAVEHVGAAIRSSRSDDTLLILKKAVETDNTPFLEQLFSYHPDFEV